MKNKNEKEHDAPSDGCGGFSDATAVGELKQVADGMDGLLGKPRDLVWRDTDDCQIWMARVDVRKDAFQIAALIPGMNPQVWFA